MKSHEQGILDALSTAIEYNPPAEGSRTLADLAHVLAFWTNSELDDDGGYDLMGDAE